MFTLVTATLAALHLMVTQWSWSLTTPTGSFTSAIELVSGSNPTLVTTSTRTLTLQMPSAGSGGGGTRGAAIIQ